MSNFSKIFTVVGILLVVFVLTLKSSFAASVLTLQWAFDEGSGTIATDSSGNSYDGTLNNGPTYLPGGGLRFNGINQYVRSNSPVSNSLGRPNQPYSISATVRVPSGTTQGNIVHVSSQADGSGWCIPMIHLNNSRFRALSWQNLSEVVITAQSNVTVDQWYSVVHTWDATNGLRLYIDGELDASTTQATYDASNTSNYIFAAYNQGACSNDQGYFDGDIKDVRIYSNALTEDEIDAINDEVHPLSERDTLESYWKLDETSSGDTYSVLDSSGDHNHGTPAGVTGANNKPQPYSDSVPSLNFPNTRALDFDGTDDVVSVANPFTANDFTISVWVNPDEINTGSYQGFIGRDDGDWAYRAPGMWVGTANSALHYDSYDTNGVRYSTDLNNFFDSAGQWVHIAWVKNGTNYDIYKNGSLFSTGNSAPATLYRGGTDYRFGGVDNFLNGKLDDIRIYSRALSSTEVSALGSGDHPPATWDGSTSNDYQTAANWNTDAVPDPYTIISIPNVGITNPQATIDFSVAGVNILTGSWLDLADYDMTIHDSGSFSNLGTLRLQNTQTLTGFTNDTDSGAVLVDPVADTTGLKTGNNYNYLLLNDGLTSYWKFDETSGGIVGDDSGYAYTGTKQGASGTNNTPQASTNVPPLNYVNTQSLDFDGTDDFVDLPDGFSDFTQGMTIAVWARPTASGAWSRFVDLANGSANNNIILNRGNNNDTLQLSVFSGSTQTYAEVTNALTLNEWHHYAVTLSDTGGVVFYKDGVQIGTGTVNVPTVVTRTSNYIGRSNWNEDDYYAGQMDDLRIYDHPLAALDIAEIAKGNQPRLSQTTLTLNQNLDVNQAMILNSGTVAAENNTLNVADDWVNNGGVFSAGTSTVHLDGGDQTITAGDSFYNLTKSVSSAQTLTIGQRAIATTSGTLTLNGTDGNLLTLSSAVSGVQTLIDPQGSRSISYLSVSDNNNIDDTEIAFSATNTYGSNLTNWLTTGPSPAPTPSPSPSPSPSPTPTFSSSGGSDELPADENIEVSFDDPVRNLDDTELTDENVDSTIILKENDENGNDIPFDATISDDKQTIIINPTQSLLSGTTIYVAIQGTLEDYDDNVITVSHRFTVRSSSSSTTTVSASNSNSTLCTEQKPGTSPDIFQVETTSTQATIYFTPVSNSSDYYISYSTRDTAEEHGFQIKLGNDGVQKVSVDSLSPSTQYFVKARGNNGCQAGDWSSIKSFTTLSSVTTNFQSTFADFMKQPRLDLKTSDLEIEQIRVSSPRAESCSYTVQPGDNLWKISEQVYGEGKWFEKIVEENQEQFPAIRKGITQGWELHLDCETVAETSTQTEEDSQKDTHEITISVTQDGKPLAFAEIELHSDPVYGTTDENGQVTFEAVEKGQHTLKIAYQSYVAEQQVTIDGENRHIDLAVNVTLKQKTLLPVWALYAIIGGLILTVVSLLGFIYRKQSVAKMKLVGYQEQS